MGKAVAISREFCGHGDSHVVDAGQSGEGDELEGLGCGILAFGSQDSPGVKLQQRVCLFQGQAEVLELHRDEITIDVVVGYGVWVYQDRWCDSALEGLNEGKVGFHTWPP